MNDELKIPLLEDLVSRGQIDSDDDQQQLDSNENNAIEFAGEERNLEEAVPPEFIPQEQDLHDNLPDEILPEVDNVPETQPEADTTDDLSDDASVRELLIDEEIRMILDKHMDKAYDEIVRLLNHKIS
jgi:hypothetical protein